MNFYTAKVKIKIEDDNGKIKKVTHLYLVQDAVSVTDVEAIVTESFKGSVNDWELVEVKESKIVEVLSNSAGSKFNV